MKQKQKKPFPFFFTSLPTFLKEDLKKVNDFAVLVRITPKITVLNYIDYVSRIFFFFFQLLIFLIILLPYVFSETFQKFVVFFWKNAGLLLASVIAESTHSPQLQPYVVLFWVNLFFLAAVIWMIAQTRHAIHNYRGLRQMHTMTEDERKDFVLQRYLHISMPTWLSPSVSQTPTPEELLKILGEQEQATEGQTQAIAATLVGEEQGEEQEESPSISKLLTLTDRITLSIIDPSGKKAMIVFTPALASLLGFLAIREEEVLRDELFKQVYGTNTGKDSLFGMQRARITDHIIEGMQKAGMLPGNEMDQPTQSQDENEIDLPTQSQDENVPASLQEEEEHASGDDPPTDALKEVRKALDLFENQTQGQRALWRITPTCTIEIFPVLSALYAKVMRAQAQPEDLSLLSIQELRQGCHHLMEEYDEGFLATHMKKGYIWSWALPPYRSYQQQCLSILSYATERERTSLDTLTNRQEKYEVVESIAQLYGWRAFVATGRDLMHKGTLSEEAMMRSLYYYGQLRKRSAARAIYQRYSELRSRIEPTYEPSEALQKRAEEVLSPSKKTA